MGEMLLNGRLYGASGIRELTQAQYDALPASKLTDGILYCIKDTGIVEGDKYAPVIYSLEEREIGVWTDGKPLYQKSYFISSLPSSVNPGYYTTNMNVSDISIKHSFGDVYWQNGVTRPIGAFGRVSSSYDDGIQITYAIEVINGIYNFYISVGRDRSNLSAMFTLQYTKTTDTPGSGSWGTDGVPMVHYDGNEKVIGTWFGETLYEKTWTNVNTVMSISGANWQEISAVDLTGVNYIVSGEFYRISGGVGDVKSNNIAEMGISLNNKLQLSYLSSLYGGTLSKITLLYTKTS